jgi:hypothetical protein
VVGKAKPSTSKATNGTEKDYVYTIEKKLKSRIIEKGIKEFFIKWEGYPE